MPAARERGRRGLFEGGALSLPSTASNGICSRGRVALSLWGKRGPGGGVDALVVAGGPREHGERERVGLVLMWIGRLRPSGGLS